MRKQGLDPDADLVAERLERDPGKRGDAGLAVAWTSPPYHHCNFTVLEGSGAAAHAHVAALLSTMDPSDPELAEPMRLEWVNRWIDGDESGYGDLVEAVAASAEPAVGVA